MNAASPPSDAPSTARPPELRLPATCDPPSETNPPKQAVWIIFGATGQMGRSLVRAALSHGDKVTAVGRTYETTPAQMDGWHERCFGLLCDVRVRATVERVIQASIRHWGRVDVIANCTGYGVVAAAEDQSQHDLLNQFNTNFHGTLNILQLSLPYFRTHRIPGRYLIFSSTAGALGVPGLAPYAASKYAVEALVESMLYETDVFSIKATLVEPGHVRQDDPPPGGPSAGGPSSAGPPVPPSAAATPSRYGHFHILPTPSPPYASPTSPAGHAKRTFAWLDSRQPTSAVRSAELVWQLAHARYPPLRLLLGAYAVESIRDRLRCVIEEIEDWKFLNFGEEEGGGGVGRGREEEGEEEEEEEGEEEGEEGVEGRSPMEEEGEEGG